MNAMQMALQASGNRFQESLILPTLMNSIRPIPRRNQNSGTPLLTRFFEKVVFGSTDCWYWRGSLNHLGYGCMAALDESKAHRVAWRLFNGDPGELMVLHKCDVRNCVNPEHLFLGTQTDNMRDMLRKGRHKNVPQHGKDNPMARLNDDQVAQMRAVRAADGRPYRVIGADFGVSAMTAYRAITRQSWRTE